MFLPCPVLRKGFKRDWIEHSKGRTTALLVSTQSQLGGLRGKAKIHLLCPRCALHGHTEGV